MANMIDYVRKNMMTFAEMPVCEADSLVLTRLAYLRFEKSSVTIPPQGQEDAAPELRELYRAEDFDDLVAYDGNLQEDSLRLLAAAAASPRYRGIRLAGFAAESDEEQREQFAAVTFLLNPNLSYIAFRGTDNTLTGWREDFLMLLDESIPSQLRALEYVRAEAATLGPQEHLILGGHSKGGNLAVYAAAMIDDETRSRIDAVYSHDGPGFSENDLKNPGFAAIRDRIHKTLPQSSLIGLIFEQECEYSIVQSNEHSVHQHNMFTWQIENNMLVNADKLTANATYIYRKMNNWISQLDAGERRHFLTLIFSLMDEIGAETLMDIRENLGQSIPAVVRAFTGMEKEDRDFLLHTLGELAKSSPEEDEEPEDEDARLEARLNSLLMMPPVN